MWIVLFVVLMDIVGIGIVAPIFPFYALRLGAGPDAATFCMALYTGALFISTPILGRLSDRYGRKPVMAISLLGSACGYTMLIFADSIWMIALSRIIGGAMAGNFGAAQAYIADRTDEKNRLKFMGYFGAAMGLGFVFGPVLGSWLGGTSFENANLVAPAAAAAGLSLLGFLGVVLFVQESAPVKDRAPKAVVPAKPFFAWLALRGEHLTDAGRKGLLVGAVACSALYQFGSGFYENIFPIWAEHFGVVQGPRGLLPMFLASGASYVLVQALVIGRLARRNQERKWLMAAGLLLMAATYAMTLAGNHGSALASTLLMAAIAACAGVIFTCANTLVSLCAAPASRGLVLGMASSVGMLGKTLTTAMSGFMFSHLGANSPYYAALLTAVVLVAIAASLRVDTDNEPEMEPG
jgi:DHA1 family tetracycline resistance protein-like MFS transporter